MIFISRGKNLGCYEAMVGNTILRLIERETWSWRFQQYLSVKYYWLHRCCGGRILRIEKLK